MDADGTYMSNHAWAIGRRTDQIGWYVPAFSVSNEDGYVGYWGYSDVPDDAAAAWRARPSMPKQD
jgi:hypothetical protein